MVRTFCLLAPVALLLSSRRSRGRGEKLATKRLPGRGSSASTTRSTAWPT